MGIPELKVDGAVASITLGSIPVFNEREAVAAPRADASKAACCAPSASSGKAPAVAAGSGSACC